MTKYRIENPEVEKAVRGLFKTQEDLESLLSAAVDAQKFDRFGYVTLEIDPSKSVTKRTCIIAIQKSDIEVVPEYNPKEWNPYPLIAPPYNGWYRTEDVDFHAALYWDDDHWIDADGEHCPEEGFGELRFKPWDDKE